MLLEYCTEISNTFKYRCFWYAYILGDIYPISYELAQIKYEVSLRQKLVVKMSHW